MRNAEREPWAGGYRSWMHDLLNYNYIFEILFCNPKDGISKVPGMTPVESVPTLFYKSK